MALDEQGWFDWMIRDPGPLSKTNPGVNAVRGVVPHSAEGYWPHLQDLLHSEARRASWAFSNLKDGRCFQHYSIYARTWTSGAGYPNNNFVAFENEGVQGEPLTDAQVANIVRIISELSALKGWTPARPLSPDDKGATLYEHNECKRWGAEPTACPSGRIPWAKILEDMPMTPAERAEMDKLRTDVEAQRKELLTLAHLIATGRTTEADARVKYMATAGNIPLP